MSGARSGGFTDECIDLGPFSIALRRPADAERLIDEERFEDDEFLPYWAEIWPSGLALARHLADGELGGTSVLEIGCGLALPSLAAAMTDADVLATDWAGEAVELVRFNAAANGIDLKAATLVWSDELEHGPFDLVLAADVLYEERNALPLLRLLERAVGSEGEALIADPGRRHASQFFERAGELGWTIDRIGVEALPRGGIVRLARPKPPATG